MAAAAALLLMDSIVIAAACQTVHCTGIEDLSIAFEYHSPIAQEV